MKMPDSPTTQQVMSAGAEAHAHSGVPGFWSAASATVLSAILCSLWLMWDTAATRSPDNDAGAVGSELALVDQQDIDGALTTLDGSPAVLARFKERTGGCPLPLAWIAVSPAAGQHGETIRLRSGHYFSPNFVLSDVPVRIAIPYPAPYEIGHGTLTVLHTGGNATVALRPAWHLSSQDTSVTHDVTWHSSQHCKQPGG
jgi:hypothetical protein